MNKFICLLALIFSFGFCGHSQWITLYEGGYGTTHSLNAEWDNYNYFESIPGNFSTSLSMSWNDSLRRKILYYLSDFQHGHAGIFRQIDEMANYTSIRVYLEMDLPDSIGTIHYTAMKDGIFTDSVNNPIYEEFASGQFGVMIPYDNTAGNNTLYLYADLLRGDSVWLRFNYIRVEADATPPLSVSSLSQTEFGVYSAGNILHLQPENEDPGFEVRLFNTLGLNVFQGSFSGKQTLPMEVESGIYTVQINDQKGYAVRKRIYLE